MINEETLKELAKSFGLALDWSNENVVPYLKDLYERVIGFEIRTSIFWIILSVIFLIIGVVFIYFSCCKISDSTGIELCFLVGILIIIVTICIIGAQVYDIITCHTLPEKIILRLIKNP